MIYENQRKLQTQTPKTKAVQQTRIKKRKEKKKKLLKFLKDTHLQIPQVEDKLQIYPLKNINKIRCVQY